LSTLEIPAEESAAPKKEAEAPKESKKEPAPVPKEERTSAPPTKSDASKTPSSGKASKQTYPLYPSVQQLLTLNGLPKEEADKIPATGPGGRLLKGDVLAYIGQIENSYPSELASRFTKLSHLDLSNIKVMAKKEAPKKTAAEAPVVVEDLPIEVALPVSLTAVMECQKRVKDSIGVFLPLSTFVARAAELANEDLPRSKVTKPTADELFNAVLGLDKVAGKYSRGNFVPQVTALPPTTMPSKRVSAPKSDILDMLAGRKTSSKRAVTGAAGVAGPLNVFSVSVPKGDEKRGRVFLERVKTVLEVEPGRLVV
jgi:pyruvate/2-oxoglutarate dehydrogenase complex dihydrolipoamide acyltransferase (E2) component